MISIRFQIILIVAMIVNLIVIVHLIKKGNMRIKYSLAWIFISVFALVLAVFPKIFLAISGMLSIYNDANALFVIAIGGLYIMSFSFSIMFSRNSNEIKNLTQELGILRSKIMELENKDRD